MMTRVVTRCVLLVCGGMRRVMLVREGMRRGVLRATAAAAANRRVAEGGTLQRASASFKAWAWFDLD